MAKIGEGFEALIVGGSRKEAPIFEVTKVPRKRIMLWTQTDDGEASVEMDQTMFEAFVKSTRELMDW